MPTTKTYADIFSQFGVSFGPVSGDNALADACPFCGKDRFYLNVTTGQYDCKKCHAQGNTTTYLTWLHRQFLAQTTNEHYLQLKAKRGIASQTLKLHELAYDASWDRWLIPFKSGQHKVANLQLYYPGKEKPNKFNLSKLPSALYGFDGLADASKDKLVYLCEGPFDAIALDYSIGAKHRDRYIVVATPGAFKEQWVEHFRGFKVCALFDNDDGGKQHSERVRKLLGESKVAEELRLLKWPEGFRDGYDINDLVKDRPDESVVGFRAHSQLQGRP